MTYFRKKNVISKFLSSNRIFLRTFFIKNSKQNSRRSFPSIAGNWINELFPLIKGFLWRFSFWFVEYENFSKDFLSNFEYCVRFFAARQQFDGNLWLNEH